MILTGQTTATGGKYNCPSSTLTTRIPCGLAWDYTEASTHTAGKTLFLALSMWEGRVVVTAVCDGLFEATIPCFLCKKPPRGRGFKI